MSDILFIRVYIKLLINKTCSNQSNTQTKWRLVKNIQNNFTQFDVLLDCLARPEWSLPRNSMPNHSPSANFVAPLKRTVPASFWSPTNWCSQCQGGSACSSQEQQLVSGLVQVLLSSHEVSWSTRNVRFDWVLSTKATEYVDCVVNKCMRWSSLTKRMWRSVQENKQTNRKKKRPLLSDHILMILSTSRKKHTVGIFLDHFHSKHNSSYDPVEYQTTASPTWTWSPRWEQHDYAVGDMKETMVNQTWYQIWAFPILLYRCT